MRGHLGVARKNMLTCECNGVTEDESQSPVCEDDMGETEVREREGRECAKSCSFLHMPAGRCGLSMPVNGPWSFLENLAVPEVHLLIQAGEASQVLGQD